MAEDVRHPHAGEPPPGIAERLEQLRALHVPEHVREKDVEARGRLAAQPSAATEPFAAAVARRLDELRALYDLANHLQGRH